MSMKTYSCEPCHKLFKNARSLASHNYKFHPMSKSAMRKQIKDPKDIVSGVTKEYSADSLPQSYCPSIAKTLDELKKLIRTLQQKIKDQEDKIEELDNCIGGSSVAKIADIEMRLGKIENTLEEHERLSLEELIHDTLEIQSLLRGKAAKTVGNKIKELKNAARAIFENFELDWNEALLLKRISIATFNDAKHFAKENATAIKTIFSTLPPNHELENIIRDDQSSEINTDENSKIENSYSIENVSINGDSSEIDFDGRDKSDDYEPNPNFSESDTSSEEDE